jgi:hypothetical protein
MDPLQPNLVAAQTNDEILGSYNQEGFNAMLEEYKANSNKLYSDSLARTDATPLAGAPPSMDQIVQDYRKLSAGIAPPPEPTQIPTQQDLMQERGAEGALNMGQSGEFSGPMPQGQSGSFSGPPVPTSALNIKPSQQTKSLSQYVGKFVDGVKDAVKTPKSLINTSIGAGVKLMAQAGPVACGQVSAAMAINAITGKNFTEGDFVGKYGFGLLNGLNSEVANNGVQYVDQGNVAPNKWGMVEKAVNELGLPVMFAANGPNFSPSGRGHIMLMTKVDGDKVTIADPAGGVKRTVSKAAIENAPSHPDGNFLFIPSVTAAFKRGKDKLGKLGKHVGAVRDYEPQKLKAQAAVTKNQVHRAAELAQIGRPDIVDSAIHNIAGFNASASFPSGSTGLGGTSPRVFERMKRDRGEEELTWEQFKNNPKLQTEYAVGNLKEHLEREGSYPRGLASYYMDNIANDGPADGTSPFDLMEEYSRSSPDRLKKLIPAGAAKYVQRTLDLKTEDEARTLIADVNADHSFHYKTWDTVAAESGPAGGFFDSVSNQIAGAIAGSITGLLPEEVFGFDFGKADQKTDFGMAKAQFDKKPLDL